MGPYTFCALWVFSCHSRQTPRGLPQYSELISGLHGGLLVHMGGGRKQTHLSSEKGVQIPCLPRCQLSRGNLGLRA